LAATARRLNQARRALAWAFGALALVVVLVAVAGWIGSSIPRNSDWNEPASGVEIMVETNGVHTALILPLVTPDKDWRGDFPAGDVARPDLPYTHVSVSWGEREVFLNTPTWWDLRPSTVPRIIGFGGDGLLHIAHYVRPAPSADARAITLTQGQYRRLVAQIERSLPTGPRIRYPGYGSRDVFYEAPGRYTVANTCNQWTSDTLAHAGVRTGWWTPFAGGVMKWVPEPDA
jgi:uncharacterized protein (TIGR02117 family)